MQLKYYSILLLISLALGFMACQEEEYSIPAAGTKLQNDCIKRSLGPNVVGLNIEFAYAMALPKDKGKLVSAQVEASIPGASGTYLENRSFYTNSSGIDVGITVGNPSVTNGKVTEVSFSKDTCASTLRYFYSIPEEARGKEVSFKFSAKDSNGKTVSYDMGPYTVAKMDMKLDMVLSDNNNMYLSIADMAVMNAATAAASPDKVDLVYLYRALTGVNFAHALVSPASDAEYLQGATLPSGAKNNTPLWKVYGLRDQQLARLQYGIYIDDPDFPKMDFTGAPNYAINMKAEYGAWVETADGKYRAYIFVNKVDNTKKEMTISIKRYTMK